MGERGQGRGGSRLGQGSQDFSRLTRWRIEEYGDGLKAIPPSVACYPMQIRIQEDQTSLPILLILRNLVNPV